MVNGDEFWNNQVRTFERSKIINGTFPDRKAYLPHIQKKSIKSAADLYQIFVKKMKDLSQEHLVAVFLNSKNKIIDYKTIFIGSANRSIVHPRDIYKEALKYAAVKIMIIHNHPSGDPTPSKEDVVFTKQLSSAGNLLQIPLLDHLIIGKDHYYSFYDHLMK